MSFLTEPEVEAYTGYRQPAAQVRFLQKNGIRFSMSRAGYPCVTWHAVNGYDEGGSDRNTEDARNARTHIRDVTVLSLQEITAPPSDAPAIGGGIYFLWADHALCYVGMARNIRERVCGHARVRDGFRPGKVIPFNSYSFFIWEDDAWRHEVELLYILRYRPPYNEKMS